MSIFALHGKRINLGANYTDEHGTQYCNLYDLEVRDMLGIVEVPEPQPPEDYSELTHYRIEQDEAPFITYPLKAQETVDGAINGELIQRIEALESRSLRVMREAVLSGDHTALQTLDDKIDKLRKKLRKLSVQTEPAVE